MKTLSRDTSPEAERIQLELIRRATVCRRLYLVSEMNRTVRSLALSGLRQRHPQADVQELRRRLADQCLGPELAERVYGPLPISPSSETVAN